MTYTRELLGELLLKAGLVTPAQLEKALEEQRKSHLKLGEVLVRDLVLTEDQIAHALAEQKGLAHINLASYPVDRDAASLIPLRMARRRGVIPVRLEGTTLTLAMADPLDVEAIDEAELLTGLNIVPVVAAASQVGYAIEKYVAGADTLLQLRIAEEEEEEEPASPQDDGTGVIVVRMVNQIIREAALERASDIHFEPSEDGVRVRYRIDGVLREAAKLPRSVHAEILSRIKVMADLDITERRRPQDGRIAVSVADKTLDLRVSTLPTPRGEEVFLRILDRDVAFLSVDELGFDSTDAERLMRMLRKPYGALFVSGPTGAGKSTTLYALLGAIHDESRKFITIEDPVEFTMQGVTQIGVNPRVGLTFTTGLRSILRSDPDVIMVGEVRDAETAEIAVSAALTGHLLLSSIHTNDAVSVLTRLTDMGIPPYLTSAALLGAVAQRLVRRLCPRCKRVADVGAEELCAFGYADDEILDLTLYEPVGCEECSGTGYQGRTGIFEVMEFNPDLQALFIRGASTFELREAALAGGMRSMRHDALDKAAAGLTSLAEIERVSL